MRHASGVFGCMVAFAIAQPLGHAEQQRAKTAVAVCGDRDNREQVHDLVREVVAEHPLLIPIDADQERFFFESRPPGEITPKISVARRALRRANRAFRSFKLDAAREHIDEIERSLAPWVGRPEARDIDRDRLKLAVSIAHASRDDARLTRALEEYAARFGAEGLPHKGTWPPSVLEQLAVLIRIGRTVLTVATRPEADVFVDGRPVGRSPVTVADLEAGTHRLVVREKGYFTQDQEVTTNLVEPTTVEVALPPMLSSTLRKTNPSEPISADLRSEIEQAIGPGRLDLLLLACYDGDDLVIQRTAMSDRAPPSEVEVVRLGEASEEEVRGALSQLVTGLGTTMPAPQTASEGIPLWAWVSAGAAVATIGVGTALRFAASSDQSDYESRQDAITQAEAFSLRDAAESKADTGSFLIGAGLIGIAALGVYVAQDELFGGDEP